MHDSSLKRIANRLTKTLNCDVFIKQTLEHLRTALHVDRVILYYFYSHWRGQITCEAIAEPQFSIVGRRGPDDCFSDDYAALYTAGRVRAISNIETANIDPCHRDLLLEFHVKANLVVPIVTEKGLWGLLIAHQCQSTKEWSSQEIEMMQKNARKLAEAAVIRES
ncbi:GAF domain-containing protein [Oxynema sp. CENA135]|uniref:GAF domain-containing protein n=1 Tax=Oxynema sp. CENA135 TaxID=984206 RepID=UPI0019097B84|nr:GAF domain-containing protein [Oxynema sp. CENA135]MBK4732206.1 GAF domain-containing protein [Oxynema sp. CENA135]